MPDRRLLEILADGEFHSGEELARILDAGPVDVHEQLTGLAELDLDLVSDGDRGYRIPGGLELLAGDRIREGLSPRAARLLQKLELRETVGSTNTEALLGLDRGWRSGSVCAAERQTAGRGRNGRSWVSPFARNLYLSVAWKYDRAAAVEGGLSLAVGVGVARALGACGVPAVQLKWPNDILADGAKLGGVLLEVVREAADSFRAVVGVGINVSMPASAGDKIDQAWTDLRTLKQGAPPGRNRLLAALLNELLPLLDGYRDDGFTPWRAQWQALDACAGMRVTLDVGGRSITGVARGVDDRGALQLETELGIEAVFGGEITLRRSS